MDHGDASDEFVSTPDSTYSVDKFYVTSRNSKDHSGGVKIAVPPEVAARIQAVIARQAIPFYRTAADVHRDALVHRLKFLEDYTKDDAPTVSAQIRELRTNMMAEAEIDSALFLRETQSRIFNKAKQLIEGANEGDYDDIASIVRKSLVALSSNRPLHSELTRILERRRP